MVFRATLFKKIVSAFLKCCRSSYEEGFSSSYQHAAIDTTFPETAITDASSNACSIASRKRFRSRSPTIIIWFLNITEEGLNDNFLIPFTANRLALIAFLLELNVTFVTMTVGCICRMSQSHVTINGIRIKFWLSKSIV